MPLRKSLASFDPCHCFLNSLRRLQSLASALDASRASRAISELVHFLLMWFVGFNFMLGNLAVDAVVHFAVSGSAAGFAPSTIFV